MAETKLEMSVFPNSRVGGVEVDHIVPETAGTGSGSLEDGELSPRQYELNESLASSTHAALLSRSRSGTNVSPTPPPGAQSNANLPLIFNPFLASESMLSTHSSSCDHGTPQEFTTDSAASTPLPTTTHKEHPSTTANDTRFTFGGGEDDLSPRSISTIQEPTPSYHDGVGFIFKAGGGGGGGGGGQRNPEEEILMSIRPTEMEQQG